MFIVQISDTHISQPGDMTCGVAPMAENLIRCVDNINALKPRPDLVLLSGDVTHNGLEAETRHAAEILGKLEIPLLIIPGNHDDRHVLAKVFGPQQCPQNKDGFVDYVVDTYPLRIIALDSLKTGKIGGHISLERLDWLRACLKDGGDRPTIIFAHHPPLNLGVPETDIDGFEGSVPMGQIIADYPNIERFLCGHIHLHTNTRWRGTIVTTAPSMGTQLTLDLRPGSISKFLLSDPAYLLHHWTPDQNLVTHPIQLSDLEGPFDFTVGA